MNTIAALGFEPELISKCMLGRLRKREWTGSAAEHDQAERIEREGQSEHGTSKAYKTLCRGWDELNRFKSICREARAHFEIHSMPWWDNGLRIFPTAMWDTLLPTMRGFERDAMEAARVLIKSYPDMIQTDRKTLGRRFKADDYPPAADLAHRFSLTFSIQPLPDPEADWRVELSVSDREELREEVAKQLKSQHDESMKHLWLRAFKSVKDIEERLSQPDRIFRNSLFEHAQQMCEMLDALNVTKEPELDDLRVRIQSQILQHQPQTIRDNPETRSEIARSARKLRAEIQKKSFIPAL